MKLTNKLCSAALLAAVGVSIALPSITKAAEEPEQAISTNKGDMDIQFTRNTADDTDTTRPELTNSDGTPVTDLTSGTVTRPLTPAVFGIQDVTPLSFGEHAIVTDGNTREFWAKNYKETNGEMANNVVIKDVRSTLNHNYTLTAQITKPMTTTVTEGNTSVERKLEGATLTYSNIQRQTNVADEIALSPDAVAPTVTVKEDAPEAVVNNTNAATPDKGQGQTYIQFGKLNAAGDTASDKSVKLTVGKDQTIFEGQYKGEVTWVLSATK
ncbi:WxL domain-containing protein [Enterococcus caccae]|uniref:WxL domain-containing protein n=1 Tax=Enterococcus caccae ATCC BAA-1240 TaxID=1158612 RepID=R3WRL7_9ENTE|nr:WxL domain-containing protein [Enterococcus caccae]EOL50471.1 hypothetical protein UC7_00464 [Enterococcus caccae ATCC BAA-1240]EOT59092.1 hypothetical protein I580_02124 [Enterococcus caccae ATCC BAA-1240]OJG25624.1 hypothetical protein RU98_GL000865 [Enterococcus caccae]